MNFATLNMLFNSFSSHKLESFTKNSLAYANESYIVTTDNKRKYVIKILKTQGAEGARVEALIQQKVYEADIVTPRYLSLKNGEIVGEVSGIKFTVSDYIIGSRDKHISPELFFSMGATMAKFHRSLEGVTIPPNNAQWLAQTNIQRDFREYNGNFKAELSIALHENLNLPALDLPTSVIHGDFTFNNIFTIQNRVTAVFDFETAQNTARVLDIARTFLSLRREVEYPADVILANLISGYNSAAQSRLTKAEITHLGDAIKYAAIACAIWCANHDQEYATEVYMGLSKETKEVVNSTIILAR